MLKDTRSTGWSRRGLLGAAAAFSFAGAARAIDLPFSGGGGEGPVATTQSGQVRGQTESGVSVFKGIPYGAPTSGGARFSAPEPVRAWGGVRPALEFGPQCPQPQVRPTAPWRSWDTHLASSEDCLSVNVWTPGVDPAARRPVMVWVHGDLGADFNSAAPVYDGGRLAARGDLVVVSLNLRLNVFGYLYLGGLDGGRYADSGNAGQLDLIAGLKWVRDNITAFGGDPGRVTLFGQGEGSTKIAALMAMPAARGLFHRAILQSGPGVTAIPAEEATRTAQAVMQAIGAGSPSALQMTPFPRLLDGYRTVLESGQGRFGPVIDGRWLSRDPFSPDGPAQSADIPVIVGYNASETTVTARTPGAFDLDWGGLNAALAPALPGRDAAQVVAAWRRARPQASAADLYFSITTEAGVGAASRALAERKAAQAAAGAWLYRLDLETPVERLRGAYGLETPLVFDTVGAAGSLLGPAAAQAQAVSDVMSAAWIAFARTGSPNAVGLPSWPRYDARARPTLLFGAVSRSVNDPDSAGRLALTQGA